MRFTGTLGSSRITRRPEKFGSTLFFNKTFLSLFPPIANPYVPQSTASVPIDSTILRISYQFLNRNADLSFFSAYARFLTQSCVFKC